MSFYILYSLPLEFSETKNLQAIEKECYFAILIKYIDGNTVRIHNIVKINPDYKKTVFNILQPGNDLYLEQMKYIIKYHRQNPPFEPTKHQWKYFHLKNKILLKSHKK